MRQPLRFAYAQQGLAGTRTDVLPFMSIELQSDTQALTVSALVDTGATNNVLPYYIGAQLGFIWEQKRDIGSLGGSLANVPARGVMVQTTVGSFEPILLAYAWLQTNDIPVILGQLNFFDEFDVCFFRSQSAFEVTRKNSLE